MVIFDRLTINIGTNMKISLVQFAPELFNRDKNRNYVVANIKNDKSDIIVFPELSFSGYYFLNRAESAENAYDFDSEEMNLFKQLASDMNKIIVIGFAEKSGDKIFNSAALLFPDKKFNCVYRKTHLFYKEYIAFDKGDTGFFNVYYPEFDINIGTMICYDWRFPESARCLGLQGADLIVCPSNLVTPLWPKVMPARAIENKTYFAVANRYGIETRNDETLVFNGRSAIYDFNGDTLAQADAEGDSKIVAEFFPERTRDKSFNPVNHIFKDRLPNMYEIICK